MQTESLRKFRTLDFSKVLSSENLHYKHFNDKSLRRYRGLYYISRSAKYSKELVDIVGSLLLCRGPMCAALHPDRRAHCLPVMPLLTRLANPMYLSVSLTSDSAVGATWAGG
jgi:hypothetical protein